MSKFVTQINHPNLKQKRESRKWHFVALLPERIRGEGLSCLKTHRFINFSEVHRAHRSQATLKVNQ